MGDLRGRDETVKLVIPGRLPGANDYIDAQGKNRYARAKMKNETEDRIALEIRRQLCAKDIRFDRHVIMHYLWIEPNMRRDMSNIAFGKKFIEDALVKCGILKNDGWKYISGFSDDFDVDKENPRVEIEFEEVL